MTPSKNEEIHEYADGWITERAGTDVPGFLKLAYPLIAGGCIVYFFLYMWGETANAERGHLVRAMNAATQASSTLMFAIAAMIIVYGIIVVAFSFRRPGKD